MTWVDNHGDKSERIYRLRGRRRLLLLSVLPFTILISVAAAPSAAADAADAATTQCH